VTYDLFPDLSTGIEQGYSNTTGVAFEAGIVYLVFSVVHVARVVFCIMFCASLFVFFHLVIVLLVLLTLMASDYLFDIFKLFFIVSWIFFLLLFLSVLG